MTTAVKQLYVVKCRLVIERDLEVRAPDRKNAEAGAREYVLNRKPLSLEAPWAVGGASFSAGGNVMPQTDDHDEVEEDDDDLDEDDLEEDDEEDEDEDDDPDEDA